MEIQLVSTLDTKTAAETLKQLVFYSKTENQVILGRIQ